VDVSRVPRTPTAKWVARTPEWHSTTNRVPIEKGGPPVSPITAICMKSKSAQSSPKRTRSALHEMQARAGAQPGLHRDHSGCLLKDEPSWNSKLRRPKSAPSTFGNSAASSAKAGKRRTNSKGSALKVTRPQSAPSMLRGWDGQRSMRMTHGDEFLQTLETSEVRNNMETLKREKHGLKDKVDGVDALADTSLYDLKVLHNARQRARTSGGRRPGSAPLIRSRASPEFPSYGSKSPADALVRMRNLREELKGDLRKNCARFNNFDMPSSEFCVVTGRRLSNVQPKDIEGLQEFFSFEDEATKKRRERHIEFVTEGIGGRYATSRASAGAYTQPKDADDQDEEHQETQDRQEPEPTHQVDMRVGVSSEPDRISPETVYSAGKVPAQRIATQRLGELVGFLIGCCGSVSAAFETFDTDSNRVLSLKEWEQGMQRLGFKDNVSYVFRLLGKGTNGAATLDEVQSLFDPFLKRSW